MEDESGSKLREVGWLLRRFVRVGAYLSAIFFGLLGVVLAFPATVVISSVVAGLLACASLTGAIAGPFITVYLLLWDGAGLIGYFYIRLFLGFPHWICSQLGFDLAGGVQLAIAGVGRLTLALLTVGTIVVVFTSTPYQSETMVTIDTVHCTTVPFLKVVFDTMNDVADWYEAGIQPVNVILDILRESLEKIVVRLWRFALRLINLLFRVISGLPDLLACSSLVTNFKAPLCSNDGCVLREIFCLIEDVYFFLVLDVLRPFLLAIVGPGPTGVAVEGFTGLAATFRLALDMVIIYSAPPLDFPCAFTLPASFPTRAQALARMQDPGLCILPRYVNMWAFWINLLLSSVQTLVDLFYAFLSMLFGSSFAGYVRDFIGLIITVVDLVRNFVGRVVEIALGVIEPLIAPIMPLIDQLFKWVGNIQSLVDRIKRLIRKFTAHPGADWHALLGGLHGQSHAHVAKALGDDFSVDDVRELEPFIEMANGTLRLDCGLTAECALELSAAGGIPPAVRELFLTDRPPVLDIVNVAGGACALQYYRTRQTCEAYKPWRSWPMYHLLTGATRLPAGDVCKSVLEDEALRHLPADALDWSSSGSSIGWSPSSSSGVADLSALLLRSSDWWLTTYAPCAHGYAALFGVEQRQFPWPDGPTAALAARLVENGAPIDYDARPALVGAQTDHADLSLRHLAVHTAVFYTQLTAATPSWLSAAVAWHGDALGTHAERNAAHAFNYLGPRPHMRFGPRSEHVKGHVDVRAPNAAPAEVALAFGELRASWADVYAGKYTSAPGPLAAKLARNARARATPLRSAPARVHSPAARRLQALNERDFNFNDDVTRPIGSYLLKAVITLLQFVANVAGRLPIVADAADALAEWVEDANYLEFLGLLEVFVESDLVQRIRDEFDCSPESDKYNARRRPLAPWQPSCVLWLQLPPKGIRAPTDWQLRTPNYGVPCAEPATTCLFDPTVPLPGSVFSGLPITNLYPRLISSGCSRYVHCSVYGLDEPFDVLIYTVELMSITSPVNLISALRSDALSTFTTWTLDITGAVFYVGLLPFGLEHYGSNLMGYKSLRDVPYVGPIIYRFQGNFVQSTAHSGCLAWNFALITTAVLVTFYVIVMLYFVLPAVATVVVTVGAAAVSVLPLLVPWFLTEQIVDDEVFFARQQQVSKPVIVYEEPSGKSA